MRAYLTGNLFPVAAAAVAVMFGLLAGGLLLSGQYTAAAASGLAFSVWTGLALSGDDDTDDDDTDEAE